MHPISLVPTAFAVCALLALPALAQVKPAPAGPTAATAAGAATTQPTGTPLPYTSAWAAYQPFGNEETRPWKDSNTTVETIGGWRAYAKESSEPTPNHDHSPAASSAKPSTPPAAPADPHAGHHKH